MRENTLKDFFLGNIAASVLEEDVNGSVIHLDNIVSHIAVEDMQDSFKLERQHVISLCKAALSGALNPENLNAIAFALIASDHFEWEDEILSEVIFDWSAPEVNFPLNEITLRMHQSWLRGEIVPQAKTPTHYSGGGRVISQRSKVSL